MASDHVTLNVGGRLFYTTKGTLEFSKACFFEAFVRRWSDSSSSASCETTEDGPNFRPLKRRREDSDSQMSPCVVVDSASGEATFTLCSTGGVVSDDPFSAPLFIDRDPDAFEDVIYFMRCSTIKPAASIDPCRLRQLQTEADFFGYEALATACKAQLSKIAELRRTPAVATAYSDTALLGNRANVNKPRREIKIPEGQVLYIEFASIWGIESLTDTQRVNLGFYRRSSERMPEGRRQLRAITIIASGKRGMEQPFAQRIGICISAKGKNDKVGLICAPVVTGILWQVHYWIGAPDQIPQLSGGNRYRGQAAQEPDMLSLLLSDICDDEEAVVLEPVDPPHEPVIDVEVGSPQDALSENF